MESWRPGDESGLLVFRGDECLTMFAIPATSEPPPSSPPSIKSTNIASNPQFRPNNDVRILFLRMRGCSYQRETPYVLVLTAFGQLVLARYWIFGACNRRNAETARTSLQNQRANRAYSAYARSGRQVRILFLKCCNLIFHVEAG
jgi:hypothetical protein